MARILIGIDGSKGADQLPPAGDIAVMFPEDAGVRVRLLGRRF